MPKEKEDIFRFHWTEARNVSVRGRGFEALGGGEPDVTARAGEKRVSA